MVGDGWDCWAWPSSTRLLPPVDCSAVDSPFLAGGVFGYQWLEACVGGGTGIRSGDLLVCAKPFRGGSTTENSILAAVVTSVSTADMLVLTFYEPCVDAERWRSR